MQRTQAAGVPRLRLEKLAVSYRVGRRATVHAVRGVSLSVAKGSTTAIIGESGSGKSSLIRALCGLTPTSGGRLYVDDFELTQVPYRLRARAAGAAGVGIVFQNPMVALDPRWPVWRSIAEALPGRGGPLRAAMSRSDKEERRARAAVALDQVGLAAAFADRRPSQLSGGQLQRVTIARALAAEPRILLYDEVVSALDVSVRNEILRLLAEVNKSFELTSLFISHDMSSVVQIASEIAVMYHGEIVESGPAADVVGQPTDPYTRKLLAAVPTISV